jgi:hypothetical protein
LLGPRLTASTAVAPSSIPSLRIASARLWLRLVPGLHKIAKRFGVGSGTVQRIAAAS